MTEDEILTKRQLIRDTLSDMVSNFLYYDRKEDEDLPLGTIEQMMDEGLTVDEMAGWVKCFLLKDLGGNA